MPHLGSQVLLSEALLKQTSQRSAGSGLGKGKDQCQLEEPSSGHGRESDIRCQMRPRPASLPQHPAQPFIRPSGQKATFARRGMLNRKSGSVTWSWALPGRYSPSLWNAGGITPKSPGKSDYVLTGTPSPSPSPIWTGVSFPGGTWLEPQPGLGCLSCPT